MLAGELSSHFLEIPNDAYTLQEENLHWNQNFANSQLLLITLLEVSQ